MGNIKSKNNRKYGILAPVSKTAKPIKQNKGIIDESVLSLIALQ